MVGVLAEHGDVGAFDVSGAAGAIAFVTQQGPETAIVFLDLATGDVRRRLALTDLRSGFLKFSVDGKTVLANRQDGTAVVDIATGRIVATSRESAHLASKPGTRAHLSASEVWLFEYEHFAGESHLSAGTREFDSCELRRARLTSDTFTFTSPGQRDLSTRFSSKFAAKPRCPVRGVVQTEAGPAAVVLDAERGRVRLVSL